MAPNWDSPKEPLVPYYARFALRVLLCRQVCDIGNIDPGSLHEAMKARLFEIGLQMNLQPSPEHSVELPTGKGGRLDMVFITRQRKLPLFAFEIDGTVRWKSIAKLDVLPDYTSKWILSTSPNLRRVRRRWAERLAGREDIHVFSVHSPGAEDSKKAG